MKKLGTETISTYWWNFGKKKNDFNGTISEWLKLYDVKISTVKHPTQKNVMGFRFKYHLGSSINTIDIYSTFADAAMQVIKLWLTHLGDKALVTGFRNYRINH